VDFSAEAATFQLQMVTVSVCAKAGAARSSMAVDAPRNFKHIENLPFSIAVLQRTWAHYRRQEICLVKREHRFGGK
jgi:hypothetical protein